MKIFPFDKIICRTPAFGINQTLADVWEELKIKIEESSPGFHELIKKIKFSDLNQLDDKTNFTIWKYFNRAKFRSTPFGSFAAVSLAKLGLNPDKLIITQQIHKNHLIDWSNKDKLSLDIVGNAKYFLSNSSIYFVGQEIRYIKVEAGSFELAAVDIIPELTALLLTCKRKTIPDDIYTLMAYTFNMEKKRVTELLAQIVDLQLLHTNLQPNITGEDYFKKLKLQCIPQASNYIIGERTVLNGNFDVHLLKHIPEMVNFFSRNFTASQNADLISFKNTFKRRFDQQEISLASIMDPEIGISYGNLAQLNDSNSLIAELKNATSNATIAKINYGKLQQFLLKKIIAGKAINLAEFKNDEDELAVLPNTFSLLFHLYKGDLVLAHTGGTTANALLGRFTMCNAEFESYGKEIANLEINANDKVLFFDIAYQSEKRVDNVNRRKQLYGYELPVLTWSDTEQPLDLNDILVAIEGNEIVLKSKKLRKRIIPRIPSAYNYTRSDLSVYRFLCDIQSQGLLTNLSFKLQDIFPSLDYYPRVNFKGIVVSPAMWLLPQASYKDIKSLENWLAANQIETSFKVGYADQSLCFDPKNELDIWAFYNYCKQQNSDFYITEALLAEQNYINDEKGNQYSPQYIVNYYHQDRIYNISPTKIQQPAQLNLPGTEWLYFEIYCHPSKSNYILLGLISVFIKKYNSYLKNWFFIRYTDPTPHIRLRLHLKSIATGFELMNALQQPVKLEMQKGFITDFKLQTYYKEMQRYGTSMDLVENFFNLDSKYVFYLIKRSQTEQELIINSLHAIQILCDLSFDELTEQLKFIKKMAQNFASEMNMENSGFKSVNASFNELKGSITKETIYAPVTLTKKRQFLFKEILSKCQNQLTKEKMLADLIHMHINRLFIADQRVYETVIYHYLMRLSQTKLALSKVK